MLRTLLLPVFSLLLIVPAHSAAPSGRGALARRMDRILATPQLNHGFWGVYVYSLTRRRVLYNHDGDHWFTPASNAKLFTLAAALQLLGPDFRFHTVLHASAAPDANGVIAGDLVIEGVGDPSFGCRPYPYRPDPEPPALPCDPMLAPRELARRLQARGVTRITGNIIGDASYFRYIPYPPGWSIGDRIWDYGAPVSALTLNDNTRYLTISPTAAGSPAQLRFDPALTPPGESLETSILTTSAGGKTDLRIRLDPATNAPILEGTIAADGKPLLETLAVRQPALYAAALLRSVLQAAGIEVDGTARARLVPAVNAMPGYDLTTWDSPPLAQILQATAKVSQNLEAELMLRVLGKLRGDTSLDELEAGRAVRREFLHNAGLDAGDADLVDGSGLARTDLVTPAGMVRLLRYMDARPDAATWRDLLPIAGEDGTLDHRFRGTAAAGRLRAKTGSLSHVNSLSGYVTTSRGERLAFSLLSNNVDRPASEVRAELDKLALALMQ
ncbi:MAG: D-alanyl-D-alanine carboxypeptidase/D-alanyl-D-alanine endopeptidase [Terriglobales bacterium]